MHQTEAPIFLGNKKISGTLVVGATTGSPPAGGMLVTGQALFADGSAAAPAISRSAVATTGFFFTAGSVRVAIGGNSSLWLGAGVALRNADSLSWSSTTDPAAASDLSLKRLAAGALARTEVIPANANYGALSIGSGPFDGSTAGFFVGSASGTGLAINAASGFGGNLIDTQIAGVSKFRVAAAGNSLLTAAASFVVTLGSGSVLRTSDAAGTIDLLPGSNAIVFGNAGDVTLARLATASLGMTTGRFSPKQGAAVASATQVTLGTDGNTFHITGTTQTDLISNVGWQGGSVVTLIFDGAVTVRHNQAASGNFKPIMLNGAANFVTAADNLLELVYDATNSKWYEVSRKV